MNIVHNGKSNLRIFVSSTSEDLEKERRRVLEGIGRLDFQAVAMESFGADSRQPIEVCLENVRNSNLYIVIVGHKYGSIVAETGKSYTQMEYEEARKIGLHCLVYLRSDKVPILPASIEQNPESLVKLKHFKDDLLEQHMVCFFNDEADLVMKAMADLCSVVIGGFRKDRFELKVAPRSYSVSRYPYEVGAAGRLRGYFRTMKKEDTLLAEPQIVSLAKGLLSKEKYAEAEKLSKTLMGSSQDRDAARTTLASIVVPPPKRPIYYCQYEMQFLPYWSRDILRDLGDFVDMLVKAAVYERTNAADVFDRTLAQAIDQFEQHLPSHMQLVNWLRKYNQLLYSPKSASERVPYPDQHRFTVRETVLIIFVTMHLADKITAISRMAALVRQDKPMRLDRTDNTER